MSAERDVAAGKRIEEFLKDEAIQAVFKELDDRYSREWREAQTTEKREFIWHLQRLLTDFQTQLKVAVGRGAMAQASLTAQARRAPIVP